MKPLQAREKRPKSPIHGPYPRLMSNGSRQERTATTSSQRPESSRPVCFVARCTRDYRAFDDWVREPLAIRLLVALRLGSVMAANATAGMTFQRTAEFCRYLLAFMSFTIPAAEHLQQHENRQQCC
jgi:hypothetical protein